MIVYNNEYTYHHIMRKDSCAIVTKWIKLCDKETLIIVFLFNDSSINSMKVDNTRQKSN